MRKNVSIPGEHRVTSTGQSAAAVGTSLKSAPGRESAAVRVLLVGMQEQTANTISAAMHSRSIFVETCPISNALLHLCRSKYEGMLIDMHAGEQALEVLRNVRSMTSNKGVVCCAVLKNRAETSAAFKAGANFVLEQPLQADVLTRTLEAAYPMMLLERRRYFRCAVQLRIEVRREDGAAHEAVSMNLSEGGLALESGVQFRSDETVHLEFQLPGGSETIFATGQVCWAQAPGRCGVQFTRISSHDALRLQKWVSDRVYELAPARPNA